jgi:hypothetical protein
MDMSPQVSATLQEMIDHHEIRKLLGVYCHGCDRGDGPSMASIYTEDSWDDHGTYRGPGKPFADRVVAAAATGRKLHHLLGQTLINVTDDEAGAETYFLATITNPDESGCEIVTLLGGRYVDNLIRKNGQWQVQNRICVRDWSRTLETAADVFSDVAFVQGAVSGLDPSYAALGLTHPAGAR